MMQKDKELLLKDLCARLPYETMFYSNSNGDECLLSIDLEYCKINELYTIEQIKPYLHPMSSMTEEEFEKLKEYSGLKYEQLDLASFQNGTYKCLDFYLSEVPSYVVILVFDWLNAHHFDYRGLIEKNLAIEAPEGMYK